MADEMVAASAEPTTTTENDPKNTEPATKRATRYGAWKSRIKQSITKRERLLPHWRLNIDRRRGKPFEDEADEDRVQVPADWSRVKAKQAQLFSQVPEVRMTARRKQFKEAAPIFTRKVNETLSDARLGVVMDEVLPDVINAAGVGAAMVAYESRQLRKAVPSVGRRSMEAMTAAGQTIPTREVPQVTDYRFTIRHVAVDDLLIPTDFIGSDFDDAAWLGESGRKSWSEALSEWDKLTSADYDKVVNRGNKRSAQNSLTENQEEGDDEAEEVTFQQIFYWRYRFHPDETSYKAIQRLVFVDGKDEPVVDEEWKGQRRTATGGIVGACKLPIRVCTLTYITNEAIPPSDTAMGRPTVDFLNRSYSQMLKNRDASMPMRWYNTNLVAQEIQTQLLRGTWQGWIPMNGSGDRAIGEVARASYPREDHEFDRVANHILDETWQTAPTQGNASGATAIRSAAEAQIHQGNFATRVGYERSRVVKFVCGIAEVTAGLLSLYGRWDQDELQALSQWNRAELPSYFLYTVRVDSTVLLDSNQRYDRMERFLNIAAKSGYLDTKPYLQEMAELVGVSQDYIRDPEPKGLDPANISLRVTAEDLRDPLVVAMLMKMNQMPSPEELDAAKRLLQAIAVPPAAPQQPGAPGADVPLAPGMATMPGRQQTAPPVLEANPEWDEATRINKRSEDGK